MSGELRTRKLPRLMGTNSVSDRKPGKATTQKEPKQNTKKEQAHQSGEPEKLVKHAPDYCETSLGYMVRLRNTERQCIGSECSQDQAGSINMVASKRKAGGPRRLPKHLIEKTQWSPNWNVICLGHGLPVPTFAGTRSSTLRPWVLSLPLTCLATLAKASAPFSMGRLCRVWRGFPGSEALR